MKKRRSAIFFALSFALFVGCGDPAGPRIPQPDDDDDEPTEPKPGFIVPK